MHGCATSLIDHCCLQRGSDWHHCQPSEGGVSLDGRTCQAEEGKRRMNDRITSEFSYETLELSDPVPKLGYFVDVWIVSNRGIINFVYAETGLEEGDG
jgi:hypothetical protein